MAMVLLFDTSDKKEHEQINHQKVKMKLFTCGNHRRGDPSLVIDWVNRPLIHPQRSYSDTNSIRNTVIWVLRHLSLNPKQTLFEVDKLLLSSRMSSKNLEYKKIILLLVFEVKNVIMK